MIFLSEQTFPEVFAVLKKMFRIKAALVDQERWQGMDVRGNPAARAYELMNVCFSVPLRGVEDLDHWGSEIRPNLPWADDHFAERVGGQPLNPGVEWRNWPWGKSAARFRNEDEVGPRFPPQDWAYLAGMIDGEGTIYWKKKPLPRFQGCIRVSQKEQTVLDYLQSVFRVGSVDCFDNKNQVLNGKEYKNPGWAWQVTSAAEVRWILQGVIPYLHIKLDKAQELYEIVDYTVKNPSKLGVPIKKVWGQDWPPRFNHTYMSRLWPKVLDGGSPMVGHNFQYGDLDSLVDLIANEPSTRQAWIPLFFPEDTGVGDGGRKPCTLGYQFLCREGQLHVWYPLRSCDLIRHFSDDCYLAVRLLLWVLDRCRLINPKYWAGVRPGSYSMHVTSLHIFENDMILIRKENDDFTSSRSKG